MKGTSGLTRDIFVEIHRGLPREGPGDDASTRRALSLVTHLPASPQVLDIGCGPGAQTLSLARATRGTIVAVDSHQPFLDELTRRAQAEGLHDRVVCVQADMAALPFPPGTFDLIWAEGSAYIMGTRAALRSWKRLLVAGGHLAFTELSWIKSNPPEEPQAFRESAYPGMKSIQENLAMIREEGCRVIGHFTLPESAWWNEYYRPMEDRIAQLLEAHQADRAASRILHQEQQEIDLYRRHSAWYGYVFYVVQTS